MKPGFDLHNNNRECRLKDMPNHYCHTLKENQRESA